MPDLTPTITIDVNKRCPRCRRLGATVRKDGTSGPCLKCGGDLLFKKTSQKILNAIWFTEMGFIRPLGIVIAEDKRTGKRRAYIGRGKGNSAAADAKQIIEWGARFETSTAECIYSMLRGHRKEAPDA